MKVACTVWKGGKCGGIRPKHYLSLFTKSFPKIEPVDIQQVISNGIAESKTIEYKRELPEDSSEAKKEFLADISSFANAEGGDIIFGIEAKNGIPIRLSNLTISDNDKILLQYESIIRDGISPRIKCEIKIIDINNSKVLLIRVYKSWNKPHTNDSGIKKWKIWTTTNRLLARFSANPCQY